MVGVRLLILIAKVVAKRHSGIVAIHVSPSILFLRIVTATARQLVRTVMLAGAWVWFVADSVGSVTAGAPLIALLNVAFLLSFIVPWRHFPATPQLEASKP
ncbi:MAG: hypothetical protein BMS9Abin12_2133 [Acidimicrobiia bacterium]|nr:MAG: hypothetical protein BMS9Abin12_2133 [Acidimicrobiia bacterium]